MDQCGRVLLNILAKLSPNAYIGIILRYKTIAI